MIHIQIRYLFIYLYIFICIYLFIYIYDYIQHILHHTSLTELSQLLRIIWKSCFEIPVKLYLRIPIHGFDCALIRVATDVWCNHLRDMILGFRLWFQTFSKHSQKFWEIPKQTRNLITKKGFENRFFSCMDGFECCMHVHGRFMDVHGCSSKPFFAKK